MSNLQMANLVTLKGEDVFTTSLELTELVTAVYEAVDLLKDIDEETSCRLEQYFQEGSGSIDVMLHAVSVLFLNNEMSLASKVLEAYEHECYATTGCCPTFLKTLLIIGGTTFNRRIGSCSSDKKVYVFLMENMTVKIGIATDIERRIKQVQSSSGMKVKKHFNTKILENALNIEWDVHNYFKNQRLLGEFFNVDFEEAVKKIEELGVGQQIEEAI